MQPGNTGKHNIEVTLHQINICILVCISLEEYPPICRQSCTFELLWNCLVVCGIWWMNINSDNFIRNLLAMPWLMVCSQDLYYYCLLLSTLWHNGGVNAPACVAHQHIPCVPACIDRCAGVDVLLQMGSKEFPWFPERYCTFGHHVSKFKKQVGWKMGSNMLSQYIRFHDIHNCDISGVYKEGYTRAHFNIQMIFNIKMPL